MKKNLLIVLIMTLCLFLVTGCSAIKEKDLIDTTWNAKYSTKTELESRNYDVTYVFKKGGKVIVSYTIAITYSDYFEPRTDNYGPFTRNWKLTDYLEVEEYAGGTFEYNKDDDTFIDISNSDIVFKRVK